MLDLDELQRQDGSVLGLIRQGMDLEAHDASRDDEVRQMFPREALSLYLQPLGISSLTDEIMDAVEALQKSEVYPSREAPNA